MPKYTPTPWYWDPKGGGYLRHITIMKNGNELQDIVAVGRASYDGSGNREQWPDGITHTQQEAEANAALIVCACNNHAALVEVANKYRNRIYNLAQNMKDEDLKNKRMEEVAQLDTLIAVCEEVL